MTIHTPTDALRAGHVPTSPTRPELPNPIRSSPRAGLCLHPRTAERRGSRTHPRCPGIRRTSRELWRRSRPRPRSSSGSPRPAARHPRRHGRAAQGRHHTRHPFTVTDVVVDDLLSDIYLHLITEEAKAMPGLRSDTDMVPMGLSRRRRRRSTSRSPSRPTRHRRRAAR